MEAKKSNVIGLGAAFVLGMLILGGSLVLMVNNLKSYDRCVTVKGLCEQENDRRSEFHRRDRFLLGCLRSCTRSYRERRRSPGNDS